MYTEYKTAPQPVLLLAEINLTSIVQDQEVHNEHKK
jgi:hypothetical protein